MYRLTLAAVLIFAAPLVRAQTGVLGTVAIADAAVTAPAGEIVAVGAGRANISGVNTVTANPARNAEVALTRGGSVLVCQTSSLHLAGSNSGPMLLALDRGAMEIRMKPDAADVVITPDLRFTMPSGGTLDLRVRVSFNGDTCVENRGRKAPLLTISDAFGEASYEVKPGQHVLFERGNLREVVDRETTACGCPPDDRTKVTIAEAAINSGGTVTPKQAEAEHPFPAAVSEGLAPPTPVPPDAPPTETHVQVASTLTYDPTAAKTVDTAPPPAAPAPETSTSGNAQKHGPFRALGRLFKHIFVR